MLLEPGLRSHSKKPIVFPDETAVDEAPESGCGLAWESWP
jgi:hypothetical protein